MLKCCTQHVYTFGRLGSGHGTGKGQVSFQSQRRAVPKHVQTTSQLHSFHMLARYCSKSFKPGFIQQHMNEELPGVQGGLRKGRGTRDQIASIHWIIEKAREFQKNMCFIDCAKAFGCVDHSSRDGNTRSSYLLPEKSVCRSRSNS